MRWLRYVDRNDTHGAKRTMGWVHAIQGAMRRTERGFYRMPRMRL